MPTDVEIHADEVVRKEFRRAGKEIRRWRLLFAAVEREVDSLRRARRLAQQFSVTKSRAREAQLASVGATSVEDLIRKYRTLLASSSNGRNIGLQSENAGSTPADATPLVSWGDTREKAER